MRRIVKTEDFKGSKQDFIIERYESASEFIETLDSRKANYETNKINQLGNWEGVKSFDKAKEMLKYGWQDEEKIKKVKDRVNKLQKEQYQKKIGFKSDIVGFAPIVPNAIIGIPQNMINTTYKPKRAKVVTFIIDIGTTGTTSTDAVLNWGAEFLSMLINIEKAGYRVRIEITDVYSSTTSYKAQVLTLPIKTENQPLDIKRIMFPLAHIAMQRVFGFEWMRRLPEGQYIPSYGRPLSRHDNDYAEFIKKQIADTENSHYICVLENLDKFKKMVA